MRITTGQRKKLRASMIKHKTPVWKENRILVETAGVVKGGRPSNISEKDEKALKALLARLENKGNGEVTAQRLWDGWRRRSKPSLVTLRRWLQRNANWKNRCVLNERAQKQGGLRFRAQKKTEKNTKKQRDPVFKCTKRASG